MQLAWKIVAGIAAVFLMIRLIQYVKRVWTSIKRLKVAEKRIKAEADEIRQMHIDKVEPQGRQVLREKAILESWTCPIPADVNQVLEKLDASVQSLFQASRKWYFPETGTDFDVEYLLARPAVQEAHQIGWDKTIQHKLLAKAGSPLILELNEDDRVIEEYPSIFHYFILAERE